MNFEIRRIEKINESINGKLHAYRVYIAMDGGLVAAPVNCTWGELLDFKRLQLEVLRLYDRVISVDFSKGTYEWERYLDDKMRNLVIVNSARQW